MLHTLLLILKIAGIILAILTGCILLSLCLVLFLPVHYRIELNRTEDEGSPPIEACARITWLLHFINIKIQYPADIYLRVRILFFTLFRLPKKRKRDKKNASDGKSKKTKKDKDHGQSQTGKGADAAESLIENTKEIRIGSKTEDKRAEVKAETGRTMPETQNPQAGHPDKVIQTEQNNENMPKEPNEIGAKDKDDETESPSGVNEADKEPRDTKAKLSLKDKLSKIWDQIKNIRYTIKRICDKIKEILKNIEYYLGIIKSDTFKQAFSLCRSELSAIFNYVKPRKYKADLTIGMGDPAATGQILSYYGMLYPFIGNNVTVTGDFDGKRIEGSVFVKGKIRLFTLLKAVVRIYFSKDIRKLLKLFKKEDV